MYENYMPLSLKQQQNGGSTYWDSVIIQKDHKLSKFSWNRLSQPLNSQIIYPTYWDWSILSPTNQKDNLVADTFFHQIFLVKLVRKNPHLMGFSTSKFFSRSRKPNQPELIELHDLVKSNTLQYLGLKIRDVYYTEIGVLLLSSKPQLKQQLLHEFHLTPASGHRGISKTSADFRPICFGQR